jgi:hypothetical protein
MPLFLLPPEPEFRKGSTHFSTDRHSNFAIPRALFSGEYQRDSEENGGGSGCFVLLGFTFLSVSVTLKLPL